MFNNQIIKLLEQKYFTSHQKDGLYLQLNIIIHFFDPMNLYNKRDLIPKMFISQYHLYILLLIDAIIKSRTNSGLRTRIEVITISLFGAIGNKNNFNNMVDMIIRILNKQDVNPESSCKKDASNNLLMYMLLLDNPLKKKSSAKSFLLYLEIKEILFDVYWKSKSNLLVALFKAHAILELFNPHSDLLNKKYIEKILYSYTNYFELLEKKGLQFQQNIDQ